MLIRGVVSSPVRGVVGSGFGEGGFSLNAFMASQSAGFWYDFTRSDTMFQEDVGPTPADEPNEDIGLALSQRLWNGQTRTGYLAGQPELVTNGNFTNASGWQTNSGWSISGGVANASVASGFYDIRSLTSITEAGKTYELTFDVTVVSGGVRWFLGGVTAPTSITASGSYRVIVPASSAIYVAFISYGGGGAFTGSIDNVSIREVSQVPATQSTTSFKVKFQLVGATGDGTDDREVTNYAAGSGENLAMLPGSTIPATLAGTQVLLGAMDGSANGAYMAITTGGALRVKWGSTTLDSTGVDLRNGVHDLGFWTDGGTLYLFADGVVVGSGAWTGTIPTTTWNLWALNNNGTASNFFAGSLSAALAGREAINLARAIQICANA